MPLVLKWRSNKEVSQFFFTNIEYDINKQNSWFNKISADKSVAYWLIEYQGNIIGVINLASIDRVSKKCNAGFYLCEMQYHQIAAFVLPFLYNYVFKILRFNKIYGEVLDGNNNIYKIHMLHQYRHIGTFKNHIFKNEEFFILRFIYQQFSHIF